MAQPFSFLLNLKKIGVSVSKQALTVVLLDGVKKILTDFTHSYNKTTLHGTLFLTKNYFSPDLTLLQSTQEPGDFLLCWPLYLCEHLHSCTIAKTVAYGVGSQYVYVHTILLP